MNRNEDLKFIREELGYLGIKEFPEKSVADLINSGKDKIQIDGTLSFSQYGKKQDMDYNIFLKNYERPNLYHPYAFQATLKDTPAKTRAFAIRHDTHFTMQDAFNMLNGRAVQKLTFDWDSKKMENQWFQLNQNKKDEHGNVQLDRLKLNGQDETMINSLKSYPIRQMMNPPERVKLLLSLFNGNSEQVSLLHEGKEQNAYVHALPKQKGVEVLILENGKLVQFRPEKAKAESIVKEEQVSQRKSKGRSI